jgi:hypothetical protein
VLAIYCRAVDRCDSELLKSVYWPDAVDNHGVFNGNAMEFIDFVIPLLRQMSQTMHQISNILIDLDGDQARVETYVCAYHLVQGEKDSTDMIFLGRYLDRFERRKGEWRIANRLVVMDWNRNHPATTVWEDGPFRDMRVRGRRWPDDPSYKMLGRGVAE